MAGKTARLDALMAKKNAGTITPDELAELNNLLAAQGVAASKAPSQPLVTPQAANPVPAPVVPTSKAPYQAMLQGEATAVPIPALQPLTEEERVAKGDAARKAALAAGKSKAEADAEALAAYMGTATPAAITPTTGIGAMGTGRGGIGDPGVSTVRVDSPSAGLVPSATPSATATPTKAAEKSAVTRLIEGLQEEEKANKPGIWDFIEAGAAGWQGRRPAYLEKAAAEAERKQKLEELARTAELETELQAEQNAAAKERALIAAGIGIPSDSLQGLTGVSGVGGLSKGQLLAAQLSAYLGGK